MRKRNNISEFLFHRLGRSWLQLVLVVALFMGLVATASAQVSYDTITGTLPDDGTQWAMVTPKPLALWNGTIILDLDGNSVRQSLSSTVKWLLAYGYAYGGTTRSPVNYNFVKAVDHLVTVRQAFINYYGLTPSRTIAWGLSRGGFVGRLCMEFHPEIFDGAIVMAGGGAGEIAVLNSKLDSLFRTKDVSSILTSPLKIVGVPNIPAATTAETAALTDLVKLANSTAEGRARLALAAAIEQFAPWTVSGSAEPASDDYDAQYAQLVWSLPVVGLNYVFSNPIVVRAPIEELAGGVVSWNHGVNYTGNAATLRQV